MHIAIVNNAATKPDSLLRLLGKNTSQVFGYAESHLVEPAHFDLLILTGSSQFPIVYNREKLQAEIALIQRSNILTLGICYGCELIAVAFGSTLKEIRMIFTRYKFYIFNTLLLVEELAAEPVRRPIVH